MTLISLRTRDGAYLTAVDGGISLTPEPTSASFFVEEGSALRCADGAWITVRDGALAIEGEPSIRMAIVRGNEKDAAIRSADGSFYVSATAGVLSAAATEIGPAETFTLDAFELGNYGCCGVRHEEAELPWLVTSHQFVVKKAAELLAKERQVENARIFSELFWSNEVFEKNVNDGLYDADFIRPWTFPELMGKSLYGYHFCHPRTMSTLQAVKTIDGGAFNAHSAISEGQRYFNLAVHAARRIFRFGKQAPDDLFKVAGHYLGLALHFFTDLTQPMHAALFANIVGEDGLIPWPPPWNDYRHREFETYADKWIKAGNLDRPHAFRATEYSDATMARWGNSSALFVVAAQDSIRVWNDSLGPLTRGKPANDDPWGSEADASLEVSLKWAPTQTARLIAYWIWCARQDFEGRAGIDRKVWFRIVEPTKGEVLAEKGDDIRRWPTQGDEGMVFVLFNADGTCSFGTRYSLDKAWRVVKGLEFYIQRADPGHQDNRFRAVPLRPEETWIYTDERLRNGVWNGDRAMCVFDTAAGTGFAGTWRPEHGTSRLDRDNESQIFKFTSTGIPISTREIETIEQKHGADFTMPWWGRLSDDPAWHAWENVGKLPAGTLTSLTVTSPGSGLLDLHALIDGATWRRRWLGIWWEWEPAGAPAPGAASALDLSGIGDPPDGTSFVTPLAAASWGGQRIDAFAIDASGNLWQKTYQ